jgi:hypothetical protein
MTVQQAIMFGALVVGASIFGSRLVTPSQMAIGPAFIWRINTIKGEMRECLGGLDQSDPRIVSDCK